MTPRSISTDNDGCSTSVDHDGRSTTTPLATSENGVGHSTPTPLVTFTGSPLATFVSVTLSSPSTSRNRTDCVTPPPLAVSTCGGGRSSPGDYTSTTAAVSFTTSTLACCFGFFIVWRFYVDLSYRAFNYIGDYATSVY